MVENGHLYPTLDLLLHTTFLFSKHSRENKQTVCFILQTSKRNPIYCCSPHALFPLDWDVFFVSLVEPLKEDYPGILKAEGVVTWWMT